MANALRETKFRLAAQPLKDPLPKISTESRVLDDAEPKTPQRLCFGVDPPHLTVNGNPIPAGIWAEQRLALLTPLSSYRQPQRLIFVRRKCAIGNRRESKHSARATTVAGPRHEGIHFNLECMNWPAATSHSLPASIAIV